MSLLTCCLNVCVCVCVICIAINLCQNQFIQISFSYQSYHHHLFYLNLNFRQPIHCTLVFINKFKNENSRRFFAFSDLVIFHLVSTSLSHRVIPSPHTHTQGALLLRTHGKRLDCNIRSRETQNLDSHLLYAELFFNRQSTAFTFIYSNK